tara:strand:- start:225 stop:1145 length:921 start_codon:yes stop_codon:yes gene_type:complete
MGIFDFLLGKPQQTVMDARSQQARDFILDELDRVYAQDPINVPKYFAQVPAAAYSGTNNLLASLGMDTVAPPNMGNNVANIGGMDVYTSDLLQKQMEQDFANRNPSLYNELVGNTNTAPTASFTDLTGSGGGSGGGGSDPYHGGDSVADFLDPNNRMGMAEHMERQKKNYAAGVSDGAMGFAKTPDGGVYAVGYKAGQMSPREAAEKGYTMTDKNPFDMSIGEHFGQIGSDVVDIAKTVANDVKDMSLIGNLVSKMTGGNDSKQSSFHDDMVAKAQERAKQKTAGLTKTQKRGGAALDSRFGISGL